MLKMPASNVNVLGQSSHLLLANAATKLAWIARQDRNGYNSQPEF